MHAKLLAQEVGGAVGARVQVRVGIAEASVNLVEGFAVGSQPGAVGSYFKLMLNGEFTRSNRNSRESYPDSEAIMVLACFDI